MVLMAHTVAVVHTAPRIRAMVRTLVMVRTVAAVREACRIQATVPMAAVVRVESPQAMVRMAARDLAELLIQATARTAAVLMEAPVRRDFLAEQPELLNVRFGDHLRGVLMARPVSRTVLTEALGDRFTDHPRMDHHTEAIPPTEQVIIHTAPATHQSTRRMAPATRLLFIRRPAVLMVASVMVTRLLLQRPFKPTLQL